MLAMILAALSGLGPAPAEGDDRPTVVIVVGTAGTPDYAVAFRQWADRWQAAAEKASAESIRVGLDADPKTTDRDRLRAILAEKASAAGKAPLWLVLIGHGSFDGREAKFNLRGPDVTDSEFAEWLAPIHRPMAILDCASASGTFLNRLSGGDRVVVTATRSGSEQNYSRFGQYLAESIADPAADLDKDGQVSLLEAYLIASSRVAEFYKSKSRLATEHALLDDNGDKLGTPADWFRGVRATRKAKDGASLDGVRAHQFCLVPNARERALTAEARARRDQLEVALAALRDEKPKLAEDEYYRRIEPIMIELAKIYAPVKEAVRP